jgi:hypothetical protein
MCPECDSTQLKITEFDFGTCPETGYHDAGERFECQDCGAEGDADDLGPPSSGELRQIKQARNSFR